MNKLFVLLSLFSLFSCSINHEKTDVMSRFSEIEKLNQIIIDNKEKIDWKDDLNQIKSKVPNAKDFIKKFESELDLTEISIVNIDGVKERLGIAYKFGNHENKSEVNYLIYSENPIHLGSLIHYEQFIDCGGSEDIGANWAFSYTNYSNCED